MPNMLSGPSLEVYRMQSIPANDVLCSEVLDHLKNIIILTYASQSDAGAVDESGVWDKDVGTVGFWGDAIVAVGYRPAVEVDSVCVYRVCAIGVYGGGTAFGFAFYVDVLEEDVAAVDDCHSPKTSISHEEMNWWMNEKIARTTSDSGEI